MIYTLNEIIEIVTPIANRYGIPTVYIFGSYARGEANEDSDIDLLITTKGSLVRTLFQLGGFIDDTENALKKKVDVVTAEALVTEGELPLFEKTVFQERKVIYDRARPREIEKYKNVL